MKKKILKITAIILLTPIALFLAYLFWPTPYFNNNMKRFDGVDIQTMLSQQQSISDEEKASFDTRKIEIPYITKGDTVDIRKMWLYMPLDTEGPVPVVYIPHYEMTPAALELHQYISQGWAVAAPAELPANNNSVMTDDGLVFNNAALYTLRNMEEIDPQRIMLCGGSAGGYMTLMLQAMQMGTLGAVANVPVTNLHYNFHQHFETRVKEVNSFWLPRAKIKMLWGSYFSDQQLIAMIKGIFEVPIPWVQVIAESFEGNGKTLGDDLNLWEAFSPVSLTECFSSPILTTHHTSDMFVPLNQIDSEHLQGLGQSIPKEFSLELDRSLPGALGKTFVEKMPKERTKVTFIPKSDRAKDITAPFDTTAMVNINILDNGPVEAYGDHATLSDEGNLNSLDYLKHMMTSSLAKTEQLMPQKLLLMLDRYQGKSIQLPAHTAVDDNVYGSLAIYQKEVVNELATYASNHSLQELDTAMLNAIGDDNDRLQSWQRIKDEINNL